MFKETIICIQLHLVSSKLLFNLIDIDLNMSFDRNSFWNKKSVVQS